MVTKKKLSFLKRFLNKFTRIPQWIHSILDSSTNCFEFINVFIWIHQQIDLNLLTNLLKFPQIQLNISTDPFKYLQIFWKCHSFLLFIIIYYLDSFGKSSMNSQIPDFFSFEPFPKFVVILLNFLSIFLNLSHFHEYLITIVILEMNSQMNSLI